MQPGVVETGRSLDHHVDINRQLQAGIARAGQIDQEGLDLLRHQALVRYAQRGGAQCVLLCGILDADGVAQLQADRRRRRQSVNGVQIKFEMKDSRDDDSLPDTR